MAALKSVVAAELIMRTVTSKTYILRYLYQKSTSVKSAKVFCMGIRSYTTENQETNTGSARNLFEVFLNNPSLLNAAKPKRDLSSPETVEQEIKQREKALRVKKLRINPHIVKWKPSSKRVGAIGVKLGMSALWLKDGRRVPVTLIQVSRKWLSLVSSMILFDTKTSKKQWSLYNFNLL